MLALTLLAGASACKRSARARCSLGQAEQVVQSASARFDGVALASLGDAALAAWSEPRGTFVRWLGTRRQGPALRVAERCASGVALALARDVAFVGCLSRDAGAYVLRLHGPALRPGARSSLSDQVGRDAQGISLALAPSGGDRSAPGALYVAWGDGEVGDPKVRLASLPEPLSPGVPTLRTLSRAHANGHEPQLLWHQDALWATWTESDLTPGKARHRVLLQRGAQPPVALAEMAGESPRPALDADREGVVLAYRAARRTGQRSELWLGRAQAGGQRLQAPARSIGRANGALGPSLALCAATRAAAVPIDHAGELYVALHPLSLALEVTEENHQYYESGRELVAGVSACVGEHPLVLLAEQTDPVRPAARLLSTTFRCASEGAPTPHARLVSSAGGLTKNP